MTYPGDTRPSALRPPRRGLDRDFHGPTTGGSTAAQPANPPISDLTTAGVGMATSSLGGCEIDQLAAPARMMLGVGPTA